MHCDDEQLQTIQVLHNTGWIFFSIMGLWGFLFGSSRGAPLRQTNYHAAQYTLYFIVTWYLAGSTQLACLRFVDDQGNVTMDTGILWNRFVIEATFVLSLVGLLTTKLSGSTLYIIFHLIMAVLSQAFWIIAALTGPEHHNSQMFWGYVTISYAALILWHLYIESRARTCSNPRFCRKVLTVFALHQLVFFLALGLGPWFLEVFNLWVQEIIAVINDIVLGLFMLSSLMHYGWVHQYVNKSLTRPGYLRNRTVNSIIVTTAKLHAHSITLE